LALLFTAPLLNGLIAKEGVKLERKKKRNERMWRTVHILWWVVEILWRAVKFVMERAPEFCAKVFGGAQSHPASNPPSNLSAAEPNRNYFVTKSARYCFLTNFAFLLLNKKAHIR
jgi:hypothetical protein